MKGERSSTWPRAGGGFISLGMLEDTAHEVAPNLWLGGQHAGLLMSDPVDWNVIVNLTSLGRSCHLGYEGLYIGWPIEDSEDVPDPSVLHPLVDLLVELLFQGKRVLVHCQAGLNRSGLVVALVMRKKGFSADGAIALLRRHRDEYCLCNADFERYVREWSL